MRIKLNYILIPLITVATSWLGSLFTMSGMEWYGQINKPVWIFPGYVFGIVWTAIFILTTIAALVAWNKAKLHQRLDIITGLFIVNIILNIGWSAVFFGWQLMGWGVVVAALLWVSVLGLMIMIWRIRKWAALLLLPYLVWVGFATYLTYVVWQLNI